jgi:hypothetical protein
MVCVEVGATVCVAVAEAVAVLVAVKDGVLVLVGVSVGIDSTILVKGALALIPLATPTAVTAIAPA